MSGVIEAGCVLLAEGGFRTARIVVEGDMIVAAEAGTPAEPTGLVLLPGMVDLHGDAIERSLMPRPGVFVPVEVALLDVDRQLLASGITTALHGLTCSWETGLRSAEMIDSVLMARDRLAERLWADHRVHVRLESHAFRGQAAVERWLRAGAVTLVSINRHFAELYRKRGDPAQVLPLATRANMTPDAYVALLEGLAAQDGAAEALLAELFALAGAAGVARASHDERTAAQRSHGRALGATLIDFPLAREAAEAARAAGEMALMGAPNVVRGGSHMQSGIGATKMVLEGLCSILASDYFYPAMPAAAFRLWREFGLGLDAAWALVSANPAAAVGLYDRGEIAVGKRADLVLVDVAGATPHVVAVWAGGRQVLGPR